ncbi:hypothetical protein [Reichenbachiella sp.]|uniref:hypothetical protein n=1 Tax=Reichenbachiella sp. TaxID=2184521 RepID=UPI003B5ABFEA
MIYSEVKELFEALGHRFYDHGAYNVNLFGIRKRGSVNEFDDILGIAFRDDMGNPVVIEHKGTTKPGLYWLKSKKGNANGTAILQPGQYPGCWMLGEHKGYPALVQKGMPFKVWRDGDEDGELDYEGKTYTDVTGLNMHTTSFNNEIDKVGAYSAGCQVRQFDEDHIAVIEILKRSAAKYGNSFSYTLIDFNS